MLCYAAVVRTNVLEECIDEQGTLMVTSNQITLRRNKKKLRGP
jgi:hypothetical protein